MYKPKSHHDDDYDAEEEIDQQAYLADLLRDEVKEGIRDEHGNMIIEKPEDKNE